MAQQTFEELVDAVKQAESRGKRYKDDGKTLTTSSKGALGEMQVMPKTIRDPGFGVVPAKDKSPDEIARVGVDYLQAMKQKYGHGAGSPKNQAETTGFMPGRLAVLATT